MSIQNVSSAAYSIANQLNADTASVSGRSNAFRDQVEQATKFIAKREFMIKLIGDNEQIDLEQVKSLRDGGALELAKS